MISNKVDNFMKTSSSIREMFEAGNRLKSELGEDNVHDFSIGNPVIPPPPHFFEHARELLTDTDSGMHRYMPNNGRQETRSFVAKQLNKLQQATFEDDDICMTVGAAGGLNILLKSLLNEGDEVMVLAPFFPEYKAYADNHGGKIVVVKPSADFALDFDNLENSISSRTTALIINSPNNPSGRVYTSEDIEKVSVVLSRHSKKLGKPIYLISDEPYRNILFDGRTPQFITNHYDNSIIVYSYSKELGIPGERIGYVAVSPNCVDRLPLREALPFSNRVMGFVNAPALMQRVIPLMGDEIIDIGEYENIRNTFHAFLTEIGFDLFKPQGGFFFFPKSPIEDDFEFCKIASKMNILVVPGSLFGLPSYFRISYCLKRETIEKSFPAFRQLMRTILS